ncbi:uncharacterized protein METZ01_LOCUS10328, partial [marine metagenome]
VGAATKLSSGNTENIAFAAMMMSVPSSLIGEPIAVSAATDSAGKFTSTRANSSP